MTRNIKYLILLIGSSIAVCVIVFSINLFFDPLWYRNGNQLEGLNYMFDERLSKTNQYVKRRSSHPYNCIIFGSSRTTLLNESLLKDPYRCFNFSFSGGRIQEFIAFAKWLKGRNVTPKYIILGIDDFNFASQKKELDIPAFIKQNSDPPNIFYSYFSLDALDMSFRLFSHAGSDPRVYDQEFLGTVIENPPQYRPTLRIKNQTLRRHAVKDYQDLKAVFPHSVFIGYIPPVSSWTTASKSQEELDFFLQSVFTISSFFDAMYDFSIPSEVTSNPENTFDGSHYFPFIQSKIIKSLNDEGMEFGINVKEFSREAYIQRYREQVQNFQSALSER